MEDENYADDDDALSREDVQIAMNSFGNCCLLEKSFNISKAAESLKEFMERVHELKTGKFTIDAWAKDLDIETTLLDPSTLEVDTVVEAVRRRTSMMKDDLRAFVRGKRTRTDL